MIYPTMSVLISGAILVAILLAADWYVWRLAYTRKSRQSHPVNPRGTAVEGEPATATGNSAHDVGRGFKRVA
jgi:membrane protein implicated in regulation of membrane protease activity